MNKMAKKSDKIIEWIDFGIFPGYCMFSVGFTYDEIIKELTELKSKNYNDIDNWIDGLQNDKKLIDSGKNFGLSRTLENTKTKETKKLSYILLVDKFGFTDYEMCKLAHEVLHICQFTLPDFMDVEREYESFAYTHTHLMGQCLKHLRGK